MLKAVSIVARGTVLAQIIGLLVLPLLTRLFRPEAFGAYQLFVSIVSILLVVASLRYEFALLRVEDEAECETILALCFCTNLVVSVLAGVAIMLFNRLVPALWPPLPFGGLLVTACLLAWGIGQYSFSLAMRRQAFSATSNAKVAQSLSYFGVAAGIGAVAPSAGGLIVADIAGRAANALYLLVAIRDLVGRAARAFSIRRVIDAARLYRQYPLLAAPSGLLGALTGTLSSILMYGIFSASLSGQFALVERSVVLPLSAAILTIAQVYQGQFSERIRNRSAALGHDYGRLIATLGLLACVPALILIAAGPALFAFVFGEQWRQAGAFARILAFSLPVQLAFGVVSTTLLLLGRPGLQFRWEIGRFGLLALIWLAIWGFGLPATYAVIGHTAALILAGLSYLYLAGRAIKDATREPGPAR